MPKYEAVEPIEHDHKRTEPGKTLVLTEEQAEPLLAIGHVKPVAAKSDAKPADEKK